MDKEKLHAIRRDRKGLEANRMVLREYARRVIVERDEDLTSIQALMSDMMREYFTQGVSLKLTPRDLVVLLYRGVLDSSPPQEG